MLPKLKPDDYLTQGYEFWKNYRIELTKLLLKEEEKLEKNPENIFKLSKEIGVKATARYFNIEPSQVRYYVKKIEKNMDSK